MNILITHVSYHCSVGVIKLLHKISKQEIHIIGCSSLEKGMSSGSLLVDKFYHAPETNTGNIYIQFIKMLIERENIDFIFSPDEEELLLFNQERDFFASKAVIPSVEVISLFRNKLKATHYMGKLGIPVPKAVTHSQILSGNIEKKVIVRENISCCSYGIYIADGTDLHNIAKHLSPVNFIQEWIDGIEYTVDVFCNCDGDPQLIIPRERLAIRGGITYKCKIVHEEQLVALCKKIYAAYHIPGFSNVQFIVSQGIPYFIELNPRIGGTTIASSLASINLMELFLSHFYKKETLAGFERYMSTVHWNSIITRYYEETIYWDESEMHHGKSEN